MHFVTGGCHCTNFTEGMVMTRTWKSLAVFLVVLGVLAAGCRSTPSGQTVGEKMDDKTILASVKTKLVAEKPSNLTKVNVDVTDGTVYLSGNVESAEQKTRAEQIAKNTKGVRSVVNNLQVRRD
jgi:hyperosmotically inducible protein